MAKKKKRQVPYKKAPDPIQIGGITLVALVALLFAWKYIPTLFAGQREVTGGSNEGACAPFASIPAAAQYDEAPPLSIDTGSQYSAAFKMEKGGEFALQLYPDKAPITVNSFVFLACKGFYNGLTFHRVMDGFMAQGGDPLGTGTGSPGYRFEDEFSDDLVFDRAGLLAMANSGPNTNGSQFFITYGPTPHLNGLHTIFGEVIEGMDVVNGLKRGSPQEDPNFKGDVIESVTITQE
ncbi:MAG: peptidylprolyl isomerase [Chloroflexota bacterium]